MSSSRSRCRDGTVFSHQQVLALSGYIRRCVILSICYLAFLTGQNGKAAGAMALAEADIHLRNKDPQEWTADPDRAVAARLDIPFDISANATDYKTLRLHQAGVKQDWHVKLNGTEIGQLVANHTRLQLELIVPDGLLKRSENRLEIASGSTIPDDIIVGGITLQSEPAGIVIGGGRVQIGVTDVESGASLPCRLTIVDLKTHALALLDVKSDDRLAVRVGVVYTLDGKVELKLRPGRYRIWAGRGFEYSLAKSDIEIAGEGNHLLALQLRREVPTPGLVACDTHLHTGEFAGHGDATLIERLITLAGEGIELPISTEHGRHVDYASDALKLGAATYFTPVIGCEVTTSEGHFNSFPILPGSEPAQHRNCNWAKIFDNIYGTPGVEVVILNHARDIHSGFRPFDRKNYDPETGRFLDGRKLEANGLELINSGAQQSDPMRLIHDWFALLKSGNMIAGVGGSDSHTVDFAIVGQARTYVPCPDADPGNLDVATAVRGFVSGETHVSFGLLVQLELKHGLARVRVLGPSWTRAEKLTLFANGDTVAGVMIPDDDAGKAGLKYEYEFALANLKVAPGQKTFLVAVAEGPGIVDPYWPIMPPYQPSSADFKPFVMGISPARWVE